MPIRMVEDDPQGNRRRKRVTRSSRSGSSAGSGIGGGMGNLIGALLPMLIRRPKLLIVVAILGVIIYFFGGKACMQQAVNQGGLNSLYQRGGVLDQDVYEQTEIYEPLADNIKNPLPESVSLLEYAPRRLNQMQQGSCVAWASAYGARTILEAKRTGKDPNSLVFSPSFMYNQISIDHNTCQGSYIKLAMDNMMSQGAIPFNDFVYDPSTCSKEPSNDLKRQANKYKIKGFQRLTDDNHSRVQEMLAIKQNLAQGSPVVIGMMVGGSFMQAMQGKEMWIPTNSDYSKYGFGGHAMCVIGYDDYKEGGAFQIMNSWGEDWGNNGICWIRYSDFKEFNVESYGLYPMGDANAKDVSIFEGAFGLSKMNTQNHTDKIGDIALRQVESNYFESTSSISTSDKFKVELTNNDECYTYIFGEELDGSSYVLFPYTEKHSPYCGITGTRLFPRDYSMQSDGKASKDKIAIVISAVPIDYKVMNEKINSASGATYQDKVSNTLSKQARKVNYSNNNGVNFRSSSEEDGVIYFVIGVKVN